MTTNRGSDALSTLRWHYEHRLETAKEEHQAGVPVVGVTSNTVPWELIRAAGFFPVLVSPQPASTPLAEAFMEPLFERRARTIFDRVLAGDYAFLSLLIIPRTSEPENKLYLYLREVVRQGHGRNVPPLQLYDLLHTRSALSRAYGLSRTAQLKARLEEIAGRGIGEEDLARAGQESNAARRVIRQLLRLRRGPAPRLGGADALAAIGAWYFMGRSRYAEVASRAVADVKRSPPLKGPRLLVKGAPLDHPRLHRFLESCGAVVVAEDDWWGSRSAGRDIGAGPDLLTRIFGKYYLDAPSPRVFPPTAADQWFQAETLREIDAVVFYLPADDDVLGWDYPRQRDLLVNRGIPSLVVREDAAQGCVSSEASARLEAFVADVGRKRPKAALADAPPY